MEQNISVNVVKIVNKRPSLVNLPVRVNIWIRPECQRAQFEVLKKAAPSIMFLQSDGGRNEKEWNAIYKNREIYDSEVDWNCTIYKLYAEKNNGLYTMGKIVSDIIWKEVDRCLFLEDDQIPSVSCFFFHEELLERYKNDLRIQCICSFNALENYRDCTSDYFFSRQGSIWGCSRWRNRVIDREAVFKKANDSYTLRLLKQRTRHNKTAWKRINAYLKNSKYEGHVAGGEFYTEFSMYGHNMLQIVPSKNLLSYIGDTSNAEHASERKLLPRAVRRLFGMKAYELEFPLKHPVFVIPDIEFEEKRNRIIGHNTPFIVFLRRIETTYYYLREGKAKVALKKIIIRIKGGKKES